ncbi:hypothetical protein Tco_0151008 [Tanacetum coccineum]
MRFKRQVTFRKSVATRSRKQGKGCSKDEGGSANNGEGCSKDVGGSAATTVEAHFEAQMEQIREINHEAYEYLVKKPNSWCIAFFSLKVKCPTFKNGIYKSYHKAIKVQRSKPIITMLEDIRIYLMQRLVVMSTNTMDLEDIITPFVRRQLEKLKIEQRNWVVIPSGFQELEVRKGDESKGSRGRGYGKGRRAAHAGRGRSGRVEEDELRSALDHEYMEQLLVEE